MRCRKGILAGAMLALPLLASTAANAQKQGGTLRIFHRDSPANMSIHEEGTISVVAPIMPIFNNLVLFNQHEKQNRLDNIVPDLADRWSWSEDGKDLTFRLHQGINWHDGKPFTAADVKCTWDLLQGKAKEKLRLNAREAWWANLDNVTVDNDYQATFHLKQPQPAFLAFLASGFFAGLSVPRLAGGDAAAPDRHGAIQIHRIQAEPVDQGREEPGLLEKGISLSRRD
jgi:peptide/nickel transport system substrate-binding protein